MRAARAGRRRGLASAVAAVALALGAAAGAHAGAREARCRTVAGTPASPSEAVLLRVARDGEARRRAVARGDAQLLPDGREMDVVLRRDENGTVLIRRRLGATPLWTLETGVVCPRGAHDELGAGLPARRPGSAVRVPGPELS